MRQKHQVHGYTVVFTIGTCGFALHSRGVAGRAFFEKYRDAVTFKRELAAHKLTTVVVPATATLELRRKGANR